MESDWDTSKRKEEGLMTGPRWSVAERRRAGQRERACGWADEVGPLRCGVRRLQRAGRPTGLMPKQKREGG